jgi:hypothetical protein
MAIPANRGSLVEVSHRPVFLTILCIFTFIGSTLWIVWSTTNFITAQVTSEIERKEGLKNSDMGGDISIDKSENRLRNNQFNETQAFAEPQKLGKYFLLQGVSAVITLFGGIFMFRLKRVGFWGYLLGNIVSIVSPVLIFGLNKTSAANSSLYFGFLGLLFVLMYAVNLKHMH